MGQEPDEEPVFSQLNKLLERKQLRAFVDSYPEVSWQRAFVAWARYRPKGMLIKWALDAPPLAPSSASADQAVLPLPATAPSSAQKSKTVDWDPGQVQEEGTIDSSRAAKPAPSSANVPEEMPLVQVGCTSTTSRERIFSWLTCISYSWRLLG